MFIAICVEYSYWLFLRFLRAVIGDASSAMPLSEPFFEMLSASSSWLALLESSGGWLCSRRWHLRLGRVIKLLRIFAKELGSESCQPAAQ